MKQNYLSGALQDIITFVYFHASNSIRKSSQRLCCINVTVVSHQIFISSALKSLFHRLDILVGPFALFFTVLPKVFREVFNMRIHEI